MSLQCGWCITRHHGSCRGADCTCECPKVTKGVYERTAGGWVTEAEVQRHPWGFRCAVDGCYYGVCCKTQDEAEHERYAHACPRKGGNMTGPSIIDKAWAQLDAETDRIYELLRDSDIKVNPTLANELARAKAAAKGKAEILALMMAPHFTTAGDIAKEAQARAVARATGVYHHTPGTTR